MLGTRLILIVSIGLLAGCTAAQTTAPDAGNEVLVSSRKSALTSIRGQVTIPDRLLVDAAKGVIADQPAAVVSNGGAGLISNGGSGFTAGYVQMQRHLLAAQTVPLRGAQVYLTTSSGTRVSNIREARTNDQGFYQVDGLSPTTNYIVVVEAPTVGGPAAQLRSISLPGKADVPVTLGSTVLTAAVASTLSTPARTAPELFDSVAKRIDEQLETAPLPSLTGGEAPLKNTLEALLATNSSLQTDLETLRTQLGSPEANSETGAEDGRSNATASATRGADNLASPSPTPSAAIATLPPVMSASDNPASAPIEATPSPSPTPSTTPTPAPITFRMTVLAGGSRGSKDGVGTEASFERPQGLALRSDGALLVADTDSGRIRQLMPDGTVTTLSGTFSGPEGLAVGPDGSIYVADTGNHRIQRINPDGAVTTFAGSVAGDADGTASVARFTAPKGLALASNGTLYVADSGNHRIRAISLGGNVTTVAGSTMGFQDGAGSAAQFSSPVSVAIGPDGNLVVADSGNGRVRYVSLEGAVTTPAGLSFGKPVGVSVDTTAGPSEGTLFVADEGTASIIRIPPGGTPTKVSGASELDFRDAVGLPIDAAGNIYLADTRNRRILLFSR